MLEVLGVHWKCVALFCYSGGSALGVRESALECVIIMIGVREKCVLQCTSVQQGKLYQEIDCASGQFPFFGWCWSECDVTLRESIPRLFNEGRFPWPPILSRLAARSSQSNPRVSGPEGLERERGHVTSESGVSEMGVFFSEPSSLMTLAVVAIVCRQLEADCWVKIGAKCVKYVWLSCPVWPSRCSGYCAFLCSGWD